MASGRTWLLVALVSSACVLGACASPEQPMAEITQIREREDRFRPYRELVSGVMKVGDAVNGGRKTLIARIDRTTGSRKTLVASEIYYQDDHHRTYEAARNERAESLRFVAVNHEGARCRRSPACMHIERIEIEVPEEQLRRAPATGYQIKILARNGPDGLITIPQPVIAALLAKVDAEPPVAAVAPRKR
jgi:hypothetical protein